MRLCVVQTALKQDLEILMLECRLVEIFILFIIYFAVLNCIIINFKIKKIKINIILNF